MRKLLPIVFLCGATLTAQDKTIFQTFQAYEVDANGSYWFTPPGAIVTLSWSGNQLTEFTQNHGIVKFRVPADVDVVTVAAEDGEYCLAPTEYSSAERHTSGDFLIINMTPNCAETRR